MSFFIPHLQRILQDYKGSLPLSIYLRTYFKSYPKLGSRDRKVLSEAVYIYYRCCRFLPDNFSEIEIIAKGYKLCKSNNAFLEKMLSEYLDRNNIETSLPNISFGISEGLAKERWLMSMMQQPQLFIRIRNNKEKSLGILKEQGIVFETVKIPFNDKENCIKIATGKAIDTLLEEQNYVVQDWASQFSIYILLNALKHSVRRVWDVCSGAGGKSILLKDIIPPFQLLVSDIRPTILHNLQTRFQIYGLGKVEKLVVNSADTKALNKKLSKQQFDLVLCDVPCSGSGTWARTPEQFHFFEEASLQNFLDIQFPIALNASKYVKQGGTLAYITCSVFELENEAVVNLLLKHNSALTLKHQQIIDGIDVQADCMFIAVFEKG